jgi:hypothetical protein
MSYFGGGSLGWSPVVAQWQPSVQGGMRPAPTDVPWPNGGRLRRHLNGLTTDATNTPLGSVLVKWFDVATDLLVASLTSDALGLYDVPIYYDGTFYAWFWKAGSPTVFGGSDRVAPV